MAARVTRLLTVAVAFATGAAFLVTAAGGGSTLGPPPGGPDLSQMALRVADFAPGARVARQGYVKPDEGFVATYEREFKELTVKLGSRRLLGLESDVYLAKNATDAEAFVIGFELGVALLDENDLAEAFTGDAPFKVTYVRVGRSFELRVGDASSGVAIRIGTRSGEIRLVLGALSVNRAAALFFLVGPPRTRLGVADARQLGILLARHMRDGLIPINTSRPGIAGVAEVGQMLTAQPGTWKNKPTRLTYQWQRCDPAGANCASLQSARARTHAVSAADIGSTLRVAVTAGNQVGAATTVSQATAVVPPTGPPVNTVAPTIGGTASVGQTLTATTGTWTGGPTSFAFAWLRCDPAGSACTSIAGDSGPTYIATGADVGSTIRVAVTATSPVGSTTAISAPTAVVT